MSLVARQRGYMCYSETIRLVHMLRSLLEYAQHHTINMAIPAGGKADNREHAPLHVAAGQGSCLVAKDVLPHDRTVH